MKKDANGYYEQEFAGESWLAAGANAMEIQRRREQGLSLVGPPVPIAEEWLMVNGTAIPKELLTFRRRIP